MNVKGRFLVFFPLLFLSYALSAAEVTAVPAKACPKAPSLWPQQNGDASGDAKGKTMFKSISVPGITNIRMATKGTAFANFYGGVLPDIAIVHGNEKLTVLRNEGCFNFKSVTELALRKNAQIPNVVDINKDGFQDIYITHSRGLVTTPKPGNTLLVSKGKNLDWTEIGDNAGVRNAEAYSRKSAFGDIDGDGWLDIAVGADNIGDGKIGYSRQRLYQFLPKNDLFTGGIFRDLGGSNFIPGFGGKIECNANIDKAGPDINLVDIDGDGDLDLIQSYHVDMTQAAWNAKCASGEYYQGVYTWRNMLVETGKPGFQLVEDNGLSYKGRMRYRPNKVRPEQSQYFPDPYKPEADGLPYLTYADVNNDGLLDVIGVGPTNPGFHVQAGMVAGRYWQNLGNFKFQEKTSAAGLDSLNWTYDQWATFFGSKALENPETNAPRCADWTQQKALCQSLHMKDRKPYWGGVAFGDFNNDGWIDFVVADRNEIGGLNGLIRNVLYMNQGNGSFEPTLTTTSGIDSNSMAIGADDIDGDGFLDLIEVVSPENSLGWEAKSQIDPERNRDVVFWNTATQGTGNHWLNIRLSGRYEPILVGAEVRIYEPGTSSLIGMRHLSTAHAYKTGSRLNAHFGIAKRTNVDVEVKLLNGVKRKFLNLSADKFYTLDMGERKQVAVLTQNSAPQAKYKLIHLERKLSSGVTEEYTFGKPATDGSYPFEKIVCTAAGKCGSPKVLTRVSAKLLEEFRMKVVRIGRALDQTTEANATLPPGCKNSEMRTYRAAQGQLELARIEMPCKNGPHLGNADAEAIMQWMDGIAGLSRW